MDIVYGEDAINNRTAHEWLAKFKSGNFDLNDTPRSSQLTDFHKKHLNALWKENPCQTTQELAEKINYDQKTICRHLASMDEAQKMRT